MVNTAGDVIGQHKGLPFYTIGQRKGLGISAPQAMYVLRLEPATNRLVVGPAEELGHQEFRARQVNYVSGQPPGAETKVTVKIRYKAKEVDATLRPIPNGKAHLSLSTPLRDITPGQSAVFFDGDQLLGGGIIELANLS
jgi:tRNA-specific 2-thiouridylase